VFQVSVHGGFVAFEGEEAVYFTRHDEPGPWRIPKDHGAESKVLDGPRCWGHWALAGADPEFDLGDRKLAHERGDIFARAAKRRS
jgi:hypothetical protein